MTTTDPTAVLNWVTVNFPTFHEFVEKFPALTSVDHMFTLGFLFSALWHKLMTEEGLDVHVDHLRMHVIKVVGEEFKIKKYSIRGDRADRAHPEGETTYPTLEAARACLPLGLTRLERSETDDPDVVELWV